ncbi:MAG TPA: sialidase family protein [Terriglobales bacterium]|nr:sialidase family protein [Terriglobales bacterium]
MNHLSYHEGWVLYENPKPHVRSRHGFFPGLVSLPNGELLALVVIGQAFESADSTTYVFRSSDKGKSWNSEGRLCDRGALAIPTSDYLKPSRLHGGSLVAIGYRFHRFDPEQAIAIEETAGILPGNDIVSFSDDNGKTWNVPIEITRSRPELLEISGPCVESASGDLLAVAARFRMPDGSNPSGSSGVLLRSRDRGRTWSDKEVFFDALGRSVTPFESRLCRMEDGALVAISWPYDYDTGTSLSNHYVISHDDGRSWSAPADTGQYGQSAGLLPCGRDHLLAIQAHRSGQNPGIYVRLVDITGGRWRAVEELEIYGIGGPAMLQGQGEATMFASLRFGQPSLLQTAPDEILGVHWCIEDGLGKIRLHRICFR